jgi:hypothetical protein
MAPAGTDMCNGGGGGEGGADRLRVGFSISATFFAEVAVHRAANWQDMGVSESYTRADGKNEGGWFWPPAPPHGPPGSCSRAPSTSRCARPLSQLGIQGGGARAHTGPPPPPPFAVFNKILSP